MDEQTFTIPTDLTTLADEPLGTLIGQAIDAFDALYGDGKQLTEDTLAQLETLAAEIDRLKAEQGMRVEVAAGIASKAADIAAKVRPAVEAEPEVVVPDTVAEIEEPMPVAAAAKTFAYKKRTPVAVPEPAGLGSVLRAAGDVPGQASGDPLTWQGLARILDRRLSAVNRRAYAAAAVDGRRMRERNTLAVLKRDIPQDLKVTSTSPEHVADVTARAVDQSRLPQGSLVASGGWCAPSERMWDIPELGGSGEGMVSIPEVGVTRGGIQFPRGPKFSDFYAMGFGPYTEADDIAGKYAGTAGSYTVGDKPCVVVPCPTWEEVRLDVIGLCLSAGLLQARAFPEMVAVTVRGALAAHRHRINHEVLARLEAGSTAVTMTADQVGAAAPLLDAIELQAEHLRYSLRLGRGATLEAVFPFWVRGVIRSDLARRAGVAYLGVTDAQIGEWFAVRGIAPQFVYDWQDLTGAASSFRAWPNSVKFLLYPAGNWIKGVADVITLDTIHDSTMLAQNDYMALFTEEALLVADLAGEGRVVSAPLCPSGAVSGGVEIGCDGVEVTAP